jgi:hypothetical protein
LGADVKTCSPTPNPMALARLINIVVWTIRTASAPAGHANDGNASGLACRRQR